MFRPALAVVLGVFVSVFALLQPVRADDLASQVDVEVAVDPSGGGTVEGAGRYKPDADITIRAVPETGFVFQKWTGKNGELLKQAEITFRTASDRHLTAHFAKPEVTVSPEILPVGSGEVQGAGRYQDGQTVTLRAIPRKGFLFAGWVNGKETKSDSLITFPAVPGVVWNARFVSATTQHSLVLHVEPSKDVGTVQGGGTYAGGTRVSLLAKPAEGYYFLYWRGAPVADLKQSSTSVLVSRDTELTAVFAEKRVRLEIEVSPKSAGSVTGAGIYRENTRVKLEATPQPGWRFVRWEGPVGEPDKARTLITCAGSVSLTAIFESVR